MSDRKVHTCVLATVDPINNCTETMPCQIPFHKVKFHYLMHYLSRGTWNHIAPKPSQADNVKITAYVCNICGKTFNNVIKKIHEGWRNFLCHYAFDHGKIVDAMKKESTVDMSQVLDILKEEVPLMKNFIEEGTKTDEDDNPVRVCMYKEKLKCPHCDVMDNNKDLSNLKLHIIHHYHHYWEGKLPEITRKDINCNKCYPSRRIAGANPEGCRLALICHLALQHGQLKDALNQDRNLPTGFVDELFATENVQSSSPVILHSGRDFNQKVTGNRYDLSLAASALKAGREKFAADIDNSRKNVIKEIKLSELVKKKEERLAEKHKKKIEKLEILAKQKEERIRKREMKALKSITHKKKAKYDSELEVEDEIELEVPEIQEQPYIRKRIKQNLKNICFDDDSDEDGDWEMKKNTGMKRFGRQSTSDAAITSDHTPLKILPKRRASGLNVASFKEVDSDEDWPYC